jgi:hypothetical protein
LVTLPRTGCGLTIIIFASGAAPDPLILVLLLFGLLAALAVSVVVVSLLVRWTHVLWVWWSTPFVALTLVLCTFLPIVDGNTALLVIGGGILAALLGCVLSRWPLVPLVLGTLAWMPGFPLVDRPYHPFDRTLLPFIAVFCAAWALFATALIRARKRSRSAAAESTASRVAAGPKDPKSR